MTKSLRPCKTRRVGWETARKPPKLREQRRGRLETLNDLGLDQFSDEGANVYEAHIKKRGRSPQPGPPNQTGQRTPVHFARDHLIEETPGNDLQLCAVRFSKR